MIDWEAERNGSTVAAKLERQTPYLPQNGVELADRARYRFLAMQMGLEGFDGARAYDRLMERYGREVGNKIWDAACNEFDRLHEED